MSRMVDVIIWESEIGLGTVGGRVCSMQVCLGLVSQVLHCLGDVVQAFTPKRCIANYVERLDIKYLFSAVSQLPDREAKWLSSRPASKIKDWI